MRMASVSWISPPLPGSCVCQGVEDRRARTRSGAAMASLLGASSGRRLLDHVRDLEDARRSPRGLAMPYWRTSLRGTSLEGDHRRRASAPRSSSIIRRTTSLSACQADDRVAQRDDERLVADERPRAEDGVAEAERLRAGACRSTARARARTPARPAAPPCRSRAGSGSARRSVSKWFSIDVLPRPGDEQHALDADLASAPRRRTARPACGRPGSISLGWDLVAGSRRVPRPATGTTATVMSSIGPIS